MKIFVLSFAFSFLTVISFAQNNTSPDQASGPTEVTMTELPLKPMRLPSLQEVSGSPFLIAEYITGVVQIDAGRTVTNVPVKFNIFNNFNNYRDFLFILYFFYYFIVKIYNMI